VQTLTAVFHRLEEGGFYATIRELPEVQTQGETLQEAGENLADALGLVLADKLEEQLGRVEERKIGDHLEVTFTE
jgi:predicted RNase H-like HicB family nuclease